MADMLLGAPAKEADPTAEQHRTKLEVFLADIDDISHTHSLLICQMSDQIEQEQVVPKTKHKAYSTGWMAKKEK